MNTELKNFVYTSHNKHLYTNTPVICINLLGSQWAIQATLTGVERLFPFHGGLTRSRALAPIYPLDGIGFLNPVES